MLPEIPFKERERVPPYTKTINNCERRGQDFHSLFHSCPSPRAKDRRMGLGERRK